MQIFHNCQRSKTVWYKTVERVPECTIGTNLRIDGSIGTLVALRTWLACCHARGAGIKSRLTRRATIRPSRTGITRQACHRTGMLNSTLMAWAHRASKSIPQHLSSSKKIDSNLGLWQKICPLFLITCSNSTHIPEQCGLEILLVAEWQKQWRGKKTTVARTNHNAF